MNDADDDASAFPPNTLIPPLEEGLLAGPPVMPFSPYDFIRGGGGSGRSSRSRPDSDNDSICDQNDICGAAMIFSMTMTMAMASP